MPRKRQRHEGDDDQRIEDDGRQDGRLGRPQPHDVERAEHRERHEEHRGNDREVLRHVVGDRERRQRAAGDEELLADLHDLDQLGRVRVEVDHVPCFFRGLRAGVHGHADVCLGERRSVVGAVAGHGDQLAVGLLASDERHLVFWRRLCQKVIDAGFGRDRRGGERVVAGDHHRLDAHRPQMREPIADAALDDVLQMNDAEGAAALGDDERRAAGAGHTLNDRGELVRHAATPADNPRLDGLGSAFANLAHVRRRA